MILCKNNIASRTIFFISIHIANGLSLAKEFSKGSIKLPAKVSASLAGVVEVLPLFFSLRL